MGQVKSAFASLPEPIEWRSFYENDLTAYLKMDDAVKQIAVEKKLCQTRPAVLDAIDQVLQGKAGNPTGHNQYTYKNGIVDNINNSTKIKRPDGTAKDYGLRKLRKYAQTRPEVEQLRHLNCLFSRLYYNLVFLLIYTVQIADLHHVSSSSEPVHGFPSHRDSQEEKSPYGLGDHDRVRKLMTPQEKGKLGGRGHKKDGNNVTIFKRGNSQEYLLARLQRDAPSFLARYHRGEFRSGH